MTPLHELLSRIRWDPQFGQGEFALGYRDRVLGRIVVVALRDVVLELHDHFAFEVTDAEGTVRRVPFHRVRQVLRNGVPIWERPERA